MLTDIYKATCPDRIKGKNTPCKYYIKDENGSIGTCTKPSHFLCIEAARTRYPRMSHSQAMVWQRCRYAYYLRYICGIKKKIQYKSSAMRMGLVWDKACNDYCDGTENAVLQVDRVYCAELHLPDKFVAMVEAVVDAANHLGLDVGVGDYQSQCEVEKQIVPEGPFIKAVYDGRSIYYSDFVERKFSMSPDRFFNVHYLNNQIGTYFLLWPEAETCTMQVVRSPARMRKRKDEEHEEFMARVRADILAKPKHYFPGYRGGSEFGRMFYRHEFDLEAEVARYTALAGDIRGCARRGEWVRNRSGCQLYGVNYPCDYLEICDGDGVNEELYEYRKKV